MSYVIFGILIFLLLRLHYKSYKIKKHDDVLFQFCNIRRDVMKYLRDNMDHISQEEYKSLKHLLKQLNILIRDYEALTSMIFDLGHLFKEADKTRKYVLILEKIKLPDNKEIERLYFNQKRAMLYAFMRYTPFVRSIILPVLVTSLKFLIQKLFSYLNEKIPQIETTIRWLEDKIKPILIFLTFYQEKADKYSVSKKLICYA